MIDAAPPGFEPSRRSTGLLAVIGPSYVRREHDRVTNALLIDERHLNSRGFVHGAVIACLLDITLGDNIAAASAEGRNGFTATLTVHYVGRARSGDWLEAAATSVHRGRRLAHAQGEVTAGKRTIATGTASFTITDHATNGAP